MNRTKILSRHLTIQKITNHLHPNPSNQQPPTDKLLSLIYQCVSTKSLQQIHTQLLIHFLPNKFNFLLSKLIILKDFDYSSLLFCHLPDPNDYAFNIMIRGLTNTWQRFDLALKFYYKMKSLGLMPNNFTYPFVFISCANLLEIQHGRLGHGMVLRSGLGVDCHVRHSLLTMYARNGELGFARKVFDEISDKDLVSWNSMISGYSRMGFAGDAIELFARMRKEGFEPNEMSLVSILVACGDLGDLGLGRWVEGYVVENEMAVNTFIGSALIGMYGKCGDLVSARRIFDGMRKKDVVTWNALITGYAQNGHSHEAISLFSSMKEAGVYANKITLSTVLSACASIGALDFGKYVDAYASEIGLQNDIYVSTALVDMYAKCGSVDHAFAVFENMQQKNEVSWNAMISALSFHGRALEALSLFNRMSNDGACRPDEITFVGILSACVHAGMVNEGRRLFDLMSSSFGLVPKIEHYTCMVDLLSRAGLVYDAWDLIERMPAEPDEIALGALLGACQKLGNVDVGERVMNLLLKMEPSNSWNYIISSKIYANSKRWDDSARMRLLMRQKGVSKVPGFSWIEMDSQVHEFHAADSSHFNSEEIYQLLDMLYDEMKMEDYVLIVH